MGFCISPLLLSFSFFLCLSTFIFLSPSHLPTSVSAAVSAAVSFTRAVSCELCPPALSAALPLAAWCLFSPALRFAVV